MRSFADWPEDRDPRRKIKSAIYDTTENARLHAHLPDGWVYVAAGIPLAGRRRQDLFRPKEAKS